MQGDGVGQFTRKKGEGTKLHKKKENQNPSSSVHWKIGIISTLF